MKIHPKCSLSAVLLGCWCGLTAARAAEPARGYQKNVAVSAPTRIDWTFALTNRSLANPPADWLGEYDSTEQHYDLYVPPGYTKTKAWPLVVFISPGAEAGGWANWERACKQYGMLFAAPLGAGNDCPQRQRVRIVLDVLDDVRRKYRIDADRTYLAGFSGGARMACAVAFALPEYFGGLVAVCASADLRQESWLRQRVIDRLSVAFLTGETDFNRGEIERWRGPLLKEVGVQSRVWVYPKLGHGIPSAQQILAVHQWLEQGLTRRRELARKYPATRVAAETAPTREELAQALLAEGKKRIEGKTTLYSGLMVLQGCSVRWPDVPAGKEAKALLLEYDARTERPWDADDIAEQRRFLIANARSLDGYVSGPLPQQYAKMRPDMARQAIELWQKVLEDGPDTKPGQEAKRRIPELEKAASKGEDDK